MMRITKQMRTETGHRLVDYNGRCAHLHGHSYLWEVTVEAEHLTSNGMVTDFKELKQAMNTVLDPLDHCMVLSPKDRLLFMPHYETEAGLDFLLQATNGQTPRLRIWHENPTAESFAKWAAQEIQKVICETDGFIPCTVVQVLVWETATSFAAWTKRGDSSCTIQESAGF